MESNVSDLLLGAGKGNKETINELITVFYGKLRNKAKAIMDEETPGHTLQATALVNEVYLEIVQQDLQHLSFENEAALLAYFSTAMRYTLKDWAKKKSREKHGGNLKRTSITFAENIGGKPGIDLECLDDALTKLAEVDKRQCQTVEMKYFSGMTNEQVASVLKISVATVKLDWRRAKRWLHNYINTEQTES